MIKPYVIAVAVFVLTTAASANPIDKRFQHPSSGVPNAVAAVPEPAAWSLMFTGMFGIGLVLRRRSRVPA